MFFGLGLGILILLLSATPQRSFASSIDFNDAMGEDGMLFVRASNAAGTASFHISAADGNWIGDSWIYNLSQPIVLADEQGESIGRLERLILFATTTRQVSLNFLVVAGQLDTAFSISSAVFDFDPIPGALGRASAGITVTDLNGDGVHLTGGHAGGTRSYRAMVNPLGPSMLFSNLVGNVALGSGASVTSSEIFPLPIGAYSDSNQQSTRLGTVSSMQSDFAFSLSALDVAAGTSVFDLITPEPATMAFCLTLAALCGRGLRSRGKRSIRRNR